MIRLFQRVLLVSVLTFVGISVPCFAETDGPPDFSQEQIAHFEKRVRPILAEHCYSCHSGEARKIKAGLRLDSRAAMLVGGDSGAAVVPGDADASLLIQAVQYDTFEMPPKGQLAKADVDALVDWVKAGVAWPPGETAGGAVAEEKFDWQERKAEHWSWQPINAVAPPSFKRLSVPTFVSGPIDAFVLQKLDEVGLKPARAADRRMLLRRIYFDLIGLPPTREQLNAFLADERPDAYERVVDELLASPHYGEKWARHWLDLVRYAESYGHEFDYSIPHAWRYRDYAIDAFNEDVGYDQFLREHFAGDLLKSPRRDEQKLNQSIVGTGFWFLGESTHSPTDVEEDQASRIENQIDVACRAFMGLSVSCARCHDHKFDPISTADYYSLSGVMKSSRRHIASLYPESVVEAAQERLAVATQDAQKQIDLTVVNGIGGQRLSQYLTAALNKDAAKDADDNAKKWLAAMQADTCKQVGHPMWMWNKLVEGDAEAASSEQNRGSRISELKREIDGQLKESVEAAGDWQVIRVEDESDGPMWYADGAAFESSRVGDLRFGESGNRIIQQTGQVAGRLNRDFSGVIRSKSFQLDGKGEVRVKVRGKNARVALTIHGYYMGPFNGLLFNRTFVKPKDLGDPNEFRWITLGNDLQKDCEAHIEVSVEKGGTVEVGEIRIAKGDLRRVKQAPHEWLVQIAANAKIDSVAALANAFADRWDACRQRWKDGKPTASDASFVDWMLQHGMLEMSVDVQKAFDVSKTTIANSTKGLPNPVKVLAVTEGSPIDGHIAIRGKAANRGEVVPRRLPVAMCGEDQPPVAGSGRMELANRMLSEENPFTARVEVNRLWHHLFGRGLVPTVCDFGEMGQPPSHPDLLDYLAEDFRTNGWSRKQAIRKMVLSNTYRMSSVAADVAKSAEIDPDNQYVHRMSVRRLTAEAIRDQLLHVSKKLKPDVGGSSVGVYLTPFMDGRGKPKGGPRDSDGRRSLYVAIRRNFLPTDLLAFDFPKPLTSIGTRTRSNVPAQSLFMMNNPLVREHADLLAKRLLEEQKEPADRLTALFETVIGIPPSEAQVRECETFLATVAKENGEDENGEKSWGDLCHVVFNMKDFIFLR